MIETPVAIDMTNPVVPASHMGMIGYMADLDHELGRTLAGKPRIS